MAAMFSSNYPRSGTQSSSGQCYSIEEYYETQYNYLKNNGTLDVQQSMYIGPNGYGYSPSKQDDRKDKNKKLQNLVAYY